jgi:hypothetical protein
MARGAPCSSSRTLAAGLTALLSAASLGCSTDQTQAPVARGGGISASQGEQTIQWFTEITDQVGLDFVHDAGDTGGYHMPEIMGAGAALFDYDNDGDLDVYLTDGYCLPDRCTREQGTNRLYRQAENGRFVDVTAEAGLGDTGYGMGMAIGDIDNDGDADVYVTNFESDRLYRNTGDGRFEEGTSEAGISPDGWSTSAAFFDYDLDGFLDLYVARYVDYRLKTKCYDDAGQRDYCGPLASRPIHDLLLRNNGDGTFSDVSETAGMTSVSAAGLGVACADFTGDGLPDVYVANDAYANQLWINQGDGTFEDEAMLAGVAVNIHGQPEAGMGVVLADFANRGTLDIFVTHLSEETNTLYRNLGGVRGFADRTGGSGLGVSSMKHTGFGTAAVDLELDGDVDLIVANGKAHVAEPMPGNLMPEPWSFFSEPNLVFLNNGQGGFERADDALRSLCAPVEVSRGLATGDVDRDGDVDILVGNITGPARLYRNDAPRKGHWLRLRAVDPRLRRDAIGARVTVDLGDRQLTRPINRGFGYQSSSDPWAHFGLGRAERVDRIEVRWPDGLTESFPGVAADQALELIRGEGRAGDG